MRIHSTLAACAALILGLTGGAWSHAEATATVGACGLITRQEAATALGAAVPVGTETTMNLPLQGHSIKAQYCLFGSEVVVAEMELGTNAQAVFAQYRQSLAAQSGYQNVDGVGDEAFAAKGQLAIRKGDIGLIIDVGQARGGGAKELRAEMGLAALALGRI